MATAVVIILPGMAVWAIIPTGSTALLIASVPLAMALSIGAASAGSAIWQRHAGSRDLVFADLMLWGWLRRIRAERRLNQAREVLGLNGGPSERLSLDRRVEALKRLSGLLEARDAYTHGHTRRVTRHAERIARAMRLPPADVAKVRTAAALHDVGKLHTPWEILNKPSRLTDEEFAVIKRHPVDGADMLSELGTEITAMVRHHHERLDGTGYPDGLAGEEIPLGARIIAVADTFDAMTSSRSYNGACQHKKALDVLSKETGAQLDAGTVSAFLRYYSGRKLVAWSALVTAAPQRFFAWMGNTTPGLGAGAGSLAQVLPAVGAAVLIAASPDPPAADDSRQAGGARVTHAAALPPSDVSAGGRVLTVRGQRRSNVRATQDRSRSRARHTAKAPRGSGATTSPSQPAEPGRVVDTSSPQPGPSTGAEPDHEPDSGSYPSAAPPAPTRPSGPDQSRPPEVKLPEVKLPAVELDIPGVKVRPVEVPDVGVPDVGLPDVEVPDVEVPDVEVPSVDILPVKLPDVDPPGGKLSRR